MQNVTSTGGNTTCPSRFISFYMYCNKSTQSKKKKILSLKRSLLSHTLSSGIMPEVFQPLCKNDKTRLIHHIQTQTCQIQKVCLDTLPCWHQEQKALCTPWELLESKQTMTAIQSHINEEGGKREAVERFSFFLPLWDGCVWMSRVSPIVGCPVPCRTSP